MSGGGFRATLFHLGALRRLNELGILAKMDSFSSVSGGSILNGVLATRWKALKASEHDGVFRGFGQLVETPVCNFCRKDLRTLLLVWKRLSSLPSLLGQRSLTVLLAEEYARRLDLGTCLAEVADEPRFVFCATNMATGVSWTFTSGLDGKMGDYVCRPFETGKTTVAQAVAASSAFPPGFPPLGVSSLRPKARTRGFKYQWLTDGGVYDNLGMEPVWKNHRLLLVSDAGLPLPIELGYRRWSLRLPFIGWAYRMQRVFDITYNQVGAVRKRWLIEMFRSKPSKLEGTYWGLGTDFRHYQLPDAHGGGVKESAAFKA